MAAHIRLVPRYGKWILFLTALFLSLFSFQLFAALAIQTESAAMRSGPGAQYPVVAWLVQGQTVEPLQSEGDYLQVQATQGGEKGWVRISEQGWGGDLISPSVSQPLAPPRDALFEGADLAYTSLAELGREDGHVFEGVHAAHAQTFWFSTPRDLDVSTGVVWVHYLASPTLSDQSLIRVDVGGQPRLTQTVSLDGRDTWLRIPLGEEDFDGSGHLAVTVRASLVVTENRCFGELLPANFLHLLPDTTVMLDLPEAARSLEGALELLPKRIVLSVAPPQTPEAYRNALVLLNTLREQSHEVELVEFPAWGDIMLASRDEVRDLLHRTYHATPELQEKYGPEIEYVNEEQNLQRLQLPDRSVILLSEPFDDIQATLVGWEWPKIARQPGYRVHTANLSGDQELVREANSIRLDDLGLDMTPHVAGPSTEWRMVLSTSQLPPNSRLDRLQLKVTSAPSAGTLPPLFYVYLNNVLQRAVRLNNDGQPEEFTVFLGESDQRTNRNYLRFVVQRSDPLADCAGPRATYPVQIDPVSTLVVDSRMDDPEQFVDLPAYFGGGVDLYLPESLLQGSATKTLAFLGNLFVSNNYVFDHHRVHFYPEGQPPKPVRPFVLVGSQGGTLDSPPVQLDKGRIQVRDFQDNMLLDLQELGNITVFQLASAGETRGLWVLPPDSGELPGGEPVTLLNDDVAFADHSGVLLTLSTQQRKISAVEYPEYRDWFDLLGQYRFWLMGLAWLLITLLVVHLYNKATQHKRHDDAVEKS